MTLLLDSTIKVSLIVLMVLGARALMRRRSAAMRHWVLSVAIGCAAAAPLLATMVPGVPGFPGWYVGLGPVFPDAPAAPTGQNVNPSRRSVPG